jgi:hypothetical protein
LVAIGSNLGRVSVLCGEIHRRRQTKKDLLETSRLLAGGDSRAIHLIYRSSSVTKRQIPSLPERRFGRDAPVAATGGIHFGALTVISSASGARYVLRVAIAARGLRGTIMTGPIEAKMS